MDIFQQRLRARFLPTYRAICIFGHIGQKSKNKKNKKKDKTHKQGSKQPASKQTNKLDDYDNNNNSNSNDEKTTTTTKSTPPLKFFKKINKK